MKLPLTLNLIKKCWLRAEQRVCDLISAKYHAHDEVFINRLLYGEVKEEFNNANEDGAFEKTIIEDLDAVFDDEILLRDIYRLSKGIVANITYHEPHIEKISGADFGLAIIRPDFEKFDRIHLKYTMLRQGILCQAKRQKPNGKFGQLTSRQIEVLPAHLDYFALLL